VKFDALIQRKGVEIFRKNGDAKVEEILMELDNVVKKEIDSKK
jgi:hypothetical protein